MESLTNAKRAFSFRDKARNPEAGPFSSLLSRLELDLLIRFP